MGSPACRLAFKCFGKSAQFVRADLGYGPIVEAAAGPFEYVVAALRRLALDFGGGRGRAPAGKPDDDAEVMFADLIDEGRGRLAGDVVQTAADDFETVRGQIG